MGKKQLVVKMPRNSSYGKRKPGSLEQRLYDASRENVIAIEAYKERLKNADRHHLPPASWAGKYIEPEIVEEIEKGKEKRYSLDDLTRIDLPMVVTGEMGIGKSALSRELVLRLIENNKIPVYINLNGAKGADIFKLIKTTIHDVSGVSINPKAVERKLEKGDFFIVFDGLDEASNKEEVIQRIKDFHSDYNDVKFIVTCRTNSYHDSLGLSNAIIKGYEKRIDELTSEEFNEHIKGNSILKELAETPLYRGMMNSIYTVKRKLEINNVSGLFNDWLRLELEKREKASASTTDIDFKLRIYKHLAFQIQATEKTDHLDEIEVREILKKYVAREKGLTPEDNSVLEVVKEIFHDNIISKGEVKFYSRPIQEFLCAAEFADRINSGRLDVKEAYNQFWSYEENKELWGVEGRALLPDWQDTLLFLAGMLDEDKAKELVDVISENYFGSKKALGEKDYNPFIEDLLFAAKMNCDQNIKNTKLNIELIHLMQNGFYPQNISLKNMSEVQDPEVSGVLMNLIEGPSSSDLKGEIASKIVNGVGNEDDRNEIFKYHFNKKYLRDSSSFRPRGKKNSSYLRQLINDSSLDDDVRIHAIRHLDKDDPVNWAFIKSKTNDSNPVIRTIAYSEMCFQPDPEDWEMFAQALMEDNVRLHGTIALEKILDYRALPYICKAVKAKKYEEGQGWRIIDLLTKLRTTKGVTEELIERLSPVKAIDYDHVSRSIVKALIASDDPIIEDLLIEKVKRGGSEIERVIEVLEEIKSKKASPILKELFNSPNIWIQYKALKAVGKIEGYQAIKEEIENRLDDMDSPEQLRVIEQTADESAIPALYRVMMNKEVHPDKRAHAIRILEKVGAYIKTDDLDRLLVDDEAVASEAAYAMDPKTPASVIIKALKYHIKKDNLGVIHTILESCHKNEDHDNLMREITQLYVETNDKYFGVQVVESIAFLKEKRDSVFLMPIYSDMLVSKWPEGKIASIRRFIKNCSREQFLEGVQRIYSADLPIDERLKRIATLKSEYRQRIKPTGYRAPEREVA